MSFRNDEKLPCPSAESKSLLRKLRCASEIKNIELRCAFGIICYLCLPLRKPLDEMADNLEAIMLQQRHVIFP